MNFAGYGNMGPAIDPAQIILDLMLQQVRATATDEEERAFLGAVGRDLAARFPLGENKDLADFEERINDVWHRVDLGAATISLADDAILIRHEFPQDASHPLGRRGGAAIAALAEGAYDAWLRASGSGPRLRTRQLSRSAHEVEFRHGA